MQTLDGFLTTEQAASSGSSRRSGNMSFASAVFNLANTIIGSGTLTMPFIFANCGWLLGNLLACLIAVLIAYSAQLLSVTSDLVAEEAASFEALGYQCCGRLGSLYAELTFIIGGLGTLTGYLVFIGKLARQVFGFKKGYSAVPMVGMVVCVIFPLAWPRRLDALKHASMLAIVAIAYVVLMYVFFATAIDDQGEEGYIPVSAVLLTSESISSLNLLLGAFCVQNTCLPIYRELAERSPVKMGKAVVCAMGVAALVYEVIGISGYVLLGGAVQGNSLLDFNTDFVHRHPWTRLPRDVAKIFMIVVLSLSFPLALWPCRSAVCSVLLRANEGCAGPARGFEGASDRMFRGVTAAIIVVVTLCAIVTPDVTIPLSLVNSLAGGSMIFVMPGLFHIGVLHRLGEEEARKGRLRATAMVVLGVLCCVGGFALQLRSIMRHNYE